MAGIDTLTAWQAALRRDRQFDGLSRFHLQRAFQRTLGLSPKAYQDVAHIDRVVRENGNPSGYRWGLERKTGLLALERERKEV